MSILKKLDELTHFIRENYPTLEFGQIRCTNEAIGHICISVLGDKSKKAKNNLVKALNNANSVLRKFLNGDSKLENKTYLRNKIESMGYSKNDFCTYNANILKSICKTLKMKDSEKNRLRMLNRCLESFRENLPCVTDKIISPRKEENMVFVENNLKESKSEHVKRRLFADGSPEKIKEEYNIDLIECNSVKSNTDLFNNFETDDKVISIREIEVNQELIDTPKRKVGSVIPSELFTPIKKFKSVHVCSTPEADLKALPKGSKNVFPESVRTFRINNESQTMLCYKKCTFVEGVVSLTDNEVKKLVKNKEEKHIIVVSDESNDLLREKFEVVNNSCVLTVKTKNTTAKGFTCYGICRHETCKQFKLVVDIKTSDTGAQLTVLSNSNDYSHSGKLTTFLKGKKRERQRQMSKYCPPMSLREKYILNSSSSRLKRGNLGNIRSDRVFYKVSHEKLSRDDQAAKDRIDVYLLKKKCPEFIKYVSEPEKPDFETYLFSKDQVEVLKKIGSVTIHVDATGTVVRETTRDPLLFLKGKNKEKRLLYYAAVIKHNGRIIPVAEYLSTRQTASAITKWLMEFRRFYENQCGTKLVAHVVSDFSPAILKAFAQAFNGCNEVVEYVNKCYDYMYEGQAFDCNVLISLCCCHLIKNISDDAHKYYKKKDNTMTHGSLACLVTACVAPAFNITDINSLDLWFTALTTVLLSPYKTEYVNIAMVILDKFSNDITSSIVNEVVKKQLVVDVELETQKRDSETIYRYKDSKFLVRFENIANQVKDSLRANADAEKNQFYSVEFFNDLMGSIIPVIPMWTGVMRSRVLDITERASNASAESWFGDLKKNKKCRRMKCGRFIKLTRNIILSRCKEVLLDIPLNYCAKGPSQSEIIQSTKRECTPSTMMIELISSSDEGEEREHWQPRKKQKGFYFKGHLKAASKKFKSPIDIIDLSPIENVVVNANCITPDVTSLSESFGLIKTVSNCVTPDSRTPDVRTPSESFDSIKSYESPVDGPQPKIALYENRLAKDINYYGKVLRLNGKPLDYTVGIYTNVIDITSSTHLNFNDYDRLSDYGNKIRKMWLSNFVIDIVLGVFREIRCEYKTEIKILNCGLTGYLYDNADYNDRQLINKCIKIIPIVVPENGLLVMPLNVGGLHWVISFANFKTGNFYYIDPSGTTEEYCQKRFKIVYEELKKNHVYGKEGNEWPNLKLNTKFKYPKQSDAYNCGVFILYYAERMIDNYTTTVRFDQNFDPMSYRKYLKNILLEKSDFMRDNCLYCGLNDKRHGRNIQVDWVQCDTCCRWIVKKCVLREQTFTRNGNFECLLCEWSKKKGHL